MNNINEGDISVESTIMSQTTQKVMKIRKNKNMTMMNMKKKLQKSTFRKRVKENEETR